MNNIINILHIEDDVQNASLLKELLSEEKEFKIFHSIDIENSLTILQKNNIDVIVLDLNLDDTKGSKTYFQLIKDINDIPIIVLSGLTDSKVKQFLFEYGIHDYISKNNFNRENLIYSIRLAKRKKASYNYDTDNTFNIDCLDSSAKPNVLIIDDVIENIKALELSLFDDLDANFIGVPSGQKALDLLKKNNDFALILLDVQMPEMDGFEVLKKINSNKSTIQIPVIMLSAVYKDKLYIRKGLDLGAVDFITKPLDIDILRLKIKQFINLYKLKKNTLKLVDSLDEANDTLAKTNTQLTLALESAGAGVWTWDIEKDFIKCDDKIIELWGQDFGNNYDAWVNSIYPEDREKATKAIQDGLDCKSQYNVIYRIIRKTDGKIRYIKAQSITLRDSNGAPLKMVGLCYDVTEFENLNRELSIQKNLAQEANVKKSEFQSMISHELRTPLNSIIGFSEFMKNQTGDINIEMQREYAEIINSNGLHLLKIVNDMLDISKIDSGKATFKYQKFSISFLMDIIIENLRVSFEEKEIEINTVIKKDITIESDMLYLRKVLFNIISNAIKFTPKEGSVTLVCERQGGNLLFSCKDSGIGIKKENLYKVFPLFEQVDGVMSRDYEGTGLGMFIAKKIVEQMNGKIWFESDGEGKGTTFFVSIPINKSD